ncbi:hypothetical protein RND81_14G112100 [Saponaria officinalis]|uniref:RING-type E3 ubiquitin transferase n=1 Tax=Saponaria officinalis TaxID=3572 RepID=A0AAW1GSQ1_SAPOF
MEKEESDKAELIVSVAISASKKAKYILKWALEKFLPEGNVTFRILHVYPKVTIVPTPIGTWLPVAQVREDVANSYRQELECKKKKTLLPYQKSLKAQKVKSDIIMLESDDIATALCLEVNKHSIRHLVVGASSTSIFSMKSLSLAKMVGNQNISAAVSENAASFCSVYVVADGKLQNLRPSESEPTVISVHNTSGRLLKSKTSMPMYPSSAPNSSTNISKPGASEPHSNNLTAPSRIREPSETAHYTLNFGNGSAVSQGSSSGDSGSWVSDRTSPGNSFVGTPPPRSFTSTPPGGSFAGTTPTGSYVGTSPALSFAETHPAESAGTFRGVSFRDNTPPGSFVGTPTGYPQAGAFVGTPPQPKSPANPDSSYSQGQIFELEKLRMELRHVEKMYELAQNNNIDEKLLFPLNQLNTLSKERLEEALKLKDEKAKEIANIEKNKHKAAQNKVESGINAQRNGPRTKKETDAAQKVEDNENKLQQLLASPVTQCQKFSWSEIVEATSSLSEEYKIGAGAFGTVFKCKLHHTTVAVKVLHSKDTVTNKQFLQELEILSTIRHPHLLLLLGAVPEESCLVYEYMENGSLDDRLFRKDNCPPLPWYERVRICWEVAGALAFLHSTKPRPIIHRDLKPANILLDQHLVSKIGDAGLGTTITMEPTDKSLKTLYKETSPVGTLCYIDPEYQRTGRVSTKSDVYALGVVILQLLTTKPAVGIAYLVEDALEEGTMMEVLDKEAGEWPEEVALELASLGLLCSELRGRDRPDLREIVLPTLERLKGVADKAREQAANAPAPLPTHFICPLSKEVMDDPYVAADGYTYNRAAIEKWLAENNTSPTTNLPLPHKFIMPNYTILEAIKQWKSNQPTK